MKKIALVTALVGVLAFGLVGCGSKSSDSTIDATKLVTLSKDQYTGVAATRESAEVTDQDIQDRITSTLEGNKTKTPITDRAVQEGDIVNIDYVGTIDGEEFAGGTNKGYELTIGSNSFIEGFETGLVGHNIGETITLNLTFPEDYASTLYAGKDVVFNVTINSISTETTPEYTDQFVQSITQDYKTTAEYTEYLKGQLQQEKEETVESDLKYGIWDQVVTSAKVSKVPQELIDKYYDLINKTYTNYAQQSGMELEDFISAYYGMDAETYEDNIQKQAKSLAKESLVVSYIAAKEKIKVSEDELNEQADSYATEYGYESADAFLEATDKDTFKESLLNDKVMQFVEDNAKITDQ